ncbi:hypothetical protein OGAPHI_000957 [Ogataea philodendri]|uniref:Uncharacterized protein n=1 Tax=Ogataea philodendri TaxID=1378263 RepID=A0A9P8PEC4_9ASCO|nr:uncharacterized protein OGAPHI_000957 [Ogataea philodendri]KAH3670442.1 hypothetical protein OGAPHI_000957 [Ogataea philodendri]
MEPASHEEFTNSSTEPSKDLGQRVENKVLVAWRRHIVSFGPAKEPSAETSNHHKQNHEQVVEQLSATFLRRDVHVDAVDVVEASNVACGVWGVVLTAADDVFEQRFVVRERIGRGKVDGVDMFCFAVSVHQTLPKQHHIGQGVVDGQNDHRGQDSLQNGAHHVEQIAKQPEHHEH